MKHPPLTITVKYDHASGKFSVSCEDIGTNFATDHFRDLGDRLSNLCAIYRKQVIGIHTESYRAPKAETPFTYSYDECNVRGFDRFGNPVLPQLDFDDLELEL